MINILFVHIPNAFRLIIDCIIIVSTDVLSNVILLSITCYR